MKRRPPPNTGENGDGHDQKLQAPQKHTPPDNVTVHLGDGPALQLFSPLDRGRLNKIIQRATTLRPDHHVFTGITLDVHGTDRTYCNVVIALSDAAMPFVTFDDLGSIRSCIPPRCIRGCMVRRCVALGDQITNDAIVVSMNLGIPAISEEGGSQGNPVEPPLDKKRRRESE